MFAFSTNESYLINFPRKRLSPHTREWCWKRPSTDVNFICFSDELKLFFIIFRLKCSDPLEERGFTRILPSNFSSVNSGQGQTANGNNWRKTNIKAPSLIVKTRRAKREKMQNHKNHNTAAELTTSQKSFAAAVAGPAYPVLTSTATTIPASIEGYIYIYIYIYLLKEIYIYIYIYLY